MSNELQSLIEQLDPPQKAAINLIKLSLDCFNGKDGTGLFSGVERYNVLAARVEVSAVQADSLTRFWALLLKRMMWPVPPKSADARILECISAPDARGVLRALAVETASIITLARMLHDQEKVKFVEKITTKQSLPIETPSLDDGTDLSELIK